MVVRAAVSVVLSEVENTECFQFAVVVNTEFDKLTMTKSRRATHKVFMAYLQHAHHRAFLFPGLKPRAWLMSCLQHDLPTRHHRIVCPKGMGTQHDRQSCYQPGCGRKNPYRVLIRSQIICAHFQRLTRGKVRGLWNFSQT